ncbi:colanic acid biosynthesis glycosyltransferase WcaL, partial [bacterium]|nr:colanic acid biosynthesis glycosyltransferase WcaL [bacterium]
DNISGRLVQERDVEALSDAILELAMAPESWEQMGKAGRDHIEEEYDVRKQVPKLEEINFGLFR